MFSPLRQIIPRTGVNVNRGGVNVIWQVEHSRRLTHRMGVNIIWQVEHSRRLTHRMGGKYNLVG